MTDLANVLDELVRDAPVEKASWSDVRARARRMSRPPRARRRVVLALAIAALLALAGTAVGFGVDRLTQQERFQTRLPDEPRRVGPVVEVVSGDEWALIAWRSEIGVCLEFAVLGRSPFGCGFPVRGAKRPTDTSGAGAPTHAVAGFVSGARLAGGDGKTTVFGVAAQDVAAVKVEFRDGRLVDAAVHDAPPELAADVKFFIVRLDLPRQPLNGDSPVAAYRAYDHEGNLIERFAD